jgi:hypothetical protein
LFGDLAAGAALEQQGLSLLDDLGGQHGRSPAAAWLIESCDAVLTEFLHAPFDADGRHAEGTYDLALQAIAQANQLGGEHTEGRVILFGMLKDRANAQEVRPLSGLADDADKIIDGRSPVGDQR